MGLIRVLNAQTANSNREKKFREKMGAWVSPLTVCTGLSICFSHARCSLSPALSLRPNRVSETNLLLRDTSHVSSNRQAESYN